MIFKRKAPGLTGVILTLVSVTPAFAYRPFDGTDADVAAPREIELEAGPVGYLREGDAHSLVAPALVLDYGFAPRFEAVLEGQQQWGLGSTQRWELADVALSLKRVLREGSLQGRGGPSVALETGLLLPGSERRLGVHVASIFSWRWPLLTLHLNLGNEILTSVEYAASTSLILEGPAAWRVRAVAELFLERDFGSPALTRGLARSVLVGAILSASDAWSFDLGLRHGQVDGGPLDEARLGCTWSWATE